MNDAVLQFMDRLGSHPNLIEKAISQLSTEVRDALRAVANSSTLDWHSNYFGGVILDYSEVPPMKFSHVEVDDRNPDAVTMVYQKNDGSTKKIALEKNHPAIISLSTLRRYISHN